MGFSVYLNRFMAKPTLISTLDVQYSICATEYKKKLDELALFVYGKEGNMYLECQRTTGIGNCLESVIRFNMMAASFVSANISDLSIKYKQCHKENSLSTMNPINEVVL